MAAALFVGGFALAWVLGQERRASALLGVAGVGVLGAFAFVLLERIIVAVV